MTQSVGVHEAKTHLSKLLARVQDGEEIAITRRGEEVARLVPAPRKTKRMLGQDRGKIWMSDDFDDPMPDEFYDMFEN